MYLENKLHNSILTSQLQDILYVSWFLSIFTELGHADVLCTLQVAG